MSDQPLEARSVKKVVAVGVGARVLGNGSELQRPQPAWCGYCASGTTCFHLCAMFAFIFRRLLSCCGMIDNSTNKIEKVDEQLQRSQLDATQLAQVPVSTLKRTQGIIQFDVPWFAVNKIPLPPSPMLH